MWRDGCESCKNWVYRSQLFQCFLVFVQETVGDLNSPTVSCSFIRTLASLTEKFGFLSDWRVEFLPENRIVAFLLSHPKFCHTFPSPHLPRHCRFAPAWNRHVPRPLHLNFTSSESLQPVLTTLRFPGAGGVGQGDCIHAQNASPHRAEVRDESAKSKGKPPLHFPICGLYLGC